MGQDRPFYGLESRGLEGEPDAQVEEMAARYIEALRTVQPAGPYLLGGWSFGGLLAFEMAQQLSRSGHRVDLVAMMDTRLPSLASEPQDDARLIVGLARDHGVQIGYEDLRLLGPDEQLRHFLDVLLRADIVPPGAALDHARRHIKAYKGDLNAMSRYAPCLYPGRLILFRAGERVPCSTGEAELGADEDPTLGWGAFSSQPVTIHEVPGNHQTMVRAPHVQILADRLRRCLLEVDPGSAVEFQAAAEVVLEKNAELYRRLA
jgi:thioesterase domain-containing protein